MSADWWQNFANNFAADLAPLLSLFGEQTTKQFLSETLTFVDIVIFSIAPIGVLTAVVSAIRVSGDPSLRAFVGRAQEGGAYAEAELCSSTSRDVCELYTSGGIARVFGRPKILEVVHDPSKGQDPTTAGIHTFKDYSSLGEENSEWTEKRTAKENSFAEHPNLSLNIGIKKRDRLWFYFAAALGLVLQGGVLIFAALVTYVYPDTFKRDDTQIAVPAFPFTFTGTILLCTGVGLCATVVERCTKERVFHRKKKACRLHWIQPGGQVIGDQVFDSFAFSETSENLLEQYTTSWKPDERTLKHGSEQATKKTLLVWAAITTTCVGFVLQFLGIRTLHSSVSVAQFVVMLVMSTVRALLRTQRLKKSDNQMGDSYTLYQGHELDWLAIKLACQEKNHGDGRWTWQIIRPFEGFSYEAVDLSRNISKVPSIHRPSTDVVFGPDIQQSFLKRARLARLTGAQSPIYTSITYGSWDSTMITSRELATSLAKAIEGVIALFYRNCTIEPMWKRTKKIRWSIPCGKEFIGPELDSHTEVTKPDCVSFTLSRQTGSTETSWKTDRSELEAALGLWLWSIRLRDRTAPTSGEIAEDDSTKFDPCSRIILFDEDATRFVQDSIPLAGESISSAESTILSKQASSFLTEGSPYPAEDWRPTANNLKLWLGYHNITFRHTTLELPPDPLSPGALLTPFREYKEDSFSDVVPRESGAAKTKPEQRRLFGYHFLPSSMLPKRKVRILEVPSESSVELMCAQEIFSAFLMSLSPIFQQVGGRTSVIRGPGKLYLENHTVSEMVRSFEESGIGSENDALACILPVLYSQGKLIHTAVFTESRDMADAHRRRNEWINAEQVLLSALNLAFQAPESEFTQYGPGAYTQYSKEQNLCILALCELYRWALLGDRHSRLFGLRGFLSICKTYDFERFSAEVFDYRDAAFAFFRRYEDEPAIRQLSKEFQSRIETSRALPGLDRKARSDLNTFGDKDFPLVLKFRDLGATLYLLKAKVVSICSSPPEPALAARNGWVTVLKVLLELGANPDEIDQDGLNYSHYASLHIANPETFLQLVGDHGYLLNRLDNRGRTSLHLAAEAGHEIKAEILMDQFSLDPHQWDLSMKSPFEYAASRYEAKTLVFLATRMVQESDESSNNGMCNILMQIAIQVATRQSESFLDKFLVTLDSWETDSTNEEIRKNVSGLHDTCDALFQQFAKTECFEFEFLECTFRKHFGPDRRLSLNVALSCKAKVNKIPIDPEEIASLDGAGRCCLHYAIKGGDEASVQKLLGTRPDAHKLNVRDWTGRTPLEYAFWNGNRTLTSLLHKFGAGTHMLPDRSSSIAADTSYCCRLYFQDSDNKLREMVVHSPERNEGFEMGPEIAVAKWRTPLAVVRRNGGDKETRLYYISEENYLCETVNDRMGWSDGTLSHKRIEVEPNTKLATLRTDFGDIRVFYQDTSGDLREIRSRDGNWESLKKIRKVPQGTAFTVLTTPEGVTQIIFQGQNFPEAIYETHTENHTRWDNGKFFRTVEHLIADKKYPSIRSIAAAAWRSQTVF